MTVRFPPPPRRPIASFLCALRALLAFVHALGHEGIPQGRDPTEGMRAAAAHLPPFQPLTSESRTLKPSCILKPSPTSGARWSDATIRLGPEFQCTSIPEYRSECCDEYEREATLLCLADVEISLAEQTATRLSEAAHKPGEWYEWKGDATDDRPLPPPFKMCGTYGCTLPDRHSGLHKVPPDPPPRLDGSPSAGWGAGFGLIPGSGAREFEFAVQYRPR